MTILLTFTQVFELATALMALIGFTGAMWQNTSQILIQNAVEGTMRARVMSLYSFNFGSAPALGAMLLGGLSALVDLTSAIALGSAAAFLVLAWIWRTREIVRRSLEN